MRRLPAPPSSAAATAAALVAVLVALLVALLTTVTAAPAWAHTRLVSSSPAQGTSAEAPVEVVLVFSDPVQAGLSAVTVTGADGRERASGTPTADGDGTSVSLALPEPLDAGSYRVAYRVLAADGHPVTGSLEFTASTASPGPDPTADPVGTAPAPGATPTAAPELAADTGDEDGGLPVLPLAVGGLAVAGVAGLVARRLGGPPTGP